MSAEGVFSATAATYDSGRRVLIPCFDDLYGTALDLVPVTARRVLDLGAGTGLLSGLVRERLPHAHLHLIDSSEPMLAQARHRLGADTKVTYQLADYTTAGWGEPYDAIVSALSIHHLEDEGKETLFSRVHGALTASGVFVNAEQISAPTPGEEHAAKIKWLAEVRTLGATEEQVAASMLRQTEDRNATVDDQLGWMRAAGFEDPRCVFRHGRFAVLFAER